MELTLNVYLDLKLEQKSDSFKVVPMYQASSACKFGCLVSQVRLEMYFIRKKEIYFKVVAGNLSL